MKCPDPVHSGVLSGDSMTRRYSFLSFGSLLVPSLLLAGCGGSNPNDVFSPPPVIAEADAGQTTPAPAAIRVTTTGTPTTTEAGGRATFAIALSAKPESTVVIPIASPTESEIKVEPNALTFGPNDWDQPKAVTLIGQDEDVDDGDQKVLIGVGPSTSSASAWNGVRSEPVEALNKDDDVAGIEVSTPTPSSATTEAGTKVTFTVRLKSRPSSPVTINVTSSVPTEGAVDKAQLVFDPADWSTARTVTVTGQDDAIADSDKPYDIDLSKPVTSDPAYALLSPAKIALTNLDDDIPGFFVFAPAPSARVTTESGGTMTFSVRLRSKPSADVTIPLSSSKTTEGSLQGVTQLVFTPANYDQLQTVTVKGVDDKLDDGDQAYTVTLGAASSTDATYQSKDPPDVDATNEDNDTAAILVSLPSTTVTTEAGGTARFTVKLASEPTAPVTLSLVSSKPAEGAVDKSQLVFDATNWSQEQTVTVKGQDDQVDDNDQAYAIQIAHKAGSVTTDAKYAALDPSDVSLTNSDDDTQGVTVGTPSGPSTTEGGGTVTIDVVLKTKPTGDVVIPVSISNAEAKANTDKLTFTTSNWNVVQTITVKGENDSIDDDDQNFVVVLGTATGGGYNVDPNDVALKNVDDDTALIQQSALTGTLTEIGGQAKFKVRLATRPAGTNTVTIPIAITAGNATRSPTSLSFTAADWDQEKEVTITGGGDGQNQSTAPSVTITVGPASGDSKYNGLSSAGFTNVSNTSACGLGGTTPNASEGETCDDANNVKCDGCESCVKQSWAALPGTSTLTVPGTAVAAAGNAQCVEAWVKTGTSADAKVFGMNGDNVTELTYALECMADGTMRLSWYDPIGLTQNTSAAHDCADGAFHHIGMCLDVGVGTVDFMVWLDGAQVMNVTPSTTFSGLTAVGIGPLDGAIDELHLFSGLRSAPFTPGRHPTTNGSTVALWRFNEGTGTTAASLPANTYPMANTGWAADTGYKTAMCQ
jgi:large repetitive protein